MTNPAGTDAANPTASPLDEQEQGTHSTDQRPRFVKPAHWSDAPPPPPAAGTDEEELSPTRYGDWVKDGIAIDF